MKYLAFAFCIILMSFNQAAPPKKVVFFGDSITQAGVNPTGYITLMQSMLKEQGRSDDFELIGEGIGGNKIYDLYLRHEADVLSHSPQLVYIWVGVNDVWHKATSGTGTDPRKFVQFYEALIDRFAQNNIDIILVTPATIGEKTDHSNPQDGDLNEYSKMIRSMAEKKGTGLIDLRQAFMEYNREHNPDNLYKGVLTTDGVHLNTTGNQFVADLFLEELLKD